MRRRLPLDVPKILKFGSVSFKVFSAKELRKLALASGS